MKLNIQPKKVIRPQCFQNSCFLCCFLTSFTLFLTSCLFLQLGVARYACITNTGNLLHNTTQSV